MKKATLFGFIFLVIFGLISFAPIHRAQAQTVPQCSQVSFSPNPPTTAGYNLSITIPQQLIQPNNLYEIRQRNTSSLEGWDSGHGYTTRDGNVVSRAFGANFAAGDSFQYMLVLNNADYCTFTSDPIMGPQGGPSCGDFVSIPENTIVGRETSITIDPSRLIEFGVGRYNVELNDNHLCGFYVGAGIDVSCNGTKNVTFFSRSNTFSVTAWTDPSTVFCSLNVTIPDTEDGEVEIGGPGGSTTVSANLCSQVVDERSRQTCNDCFDNHSGVWTAVGCIPTNPQSIISTFMRIGLGIAGGVALIMILAAGFLFSTSQGDIKRTGEAKELLTSAVMGLLFIIFSVVILQFIGVSILQIPGFGGP